jgi:uncharacterized protein YkwD
MTMGMGRMLFLAVAALAAAFALAGCDATTVGTDSAAVRLAADQPTTKPAAVEPTEGRLGDATELRAGTPPRELSHGGPLDARRHGTPPRRDGVGAGAACPNPDLAPSVASLPAMANATLCLLNGERADNGLAPLVPNAKLAVAATAYAQDLVAGSYFSHAGRDGSGVFERIDRTGYMPRNSGWILGENLAWGTGSLATPGAIMQAWMNSDGHRHNILDPDYREIGIGIVAGNPAATNGLGATYATEFGAIESSPESEPVAAAKPAQDSPRARRARKRARRHARARIARRARHVSPGGKGRGRAGGKRRGKVGRVTARIAI